MCRIVFSISFSRQNWKVQLVFTSTKSRRNFYTQVERQSFHTAWVKTGKAQCEHMFSGLSPKPDIAQCGQHVRFVPKPEVFSGLGHVPLAQWMSSPPTTAGARHARVSNIWSRAGRSTTCICYCSSHYRGSHICPRNLRLDSHIAPRPSLLLPVS